MDNRLISLKWKADEKYKELEFAVGQLQTHIQQIHSRKKALKSTVLSNVVILLIVFIVLELFCRSLKLGSILGPGFIIVERLIMILRILIQTNFSIKIFNSGIPLVKSGLVSFFQPSLLGKGYTLYDELAKCNVYLANSKSDMQKIIELQEELENIEEEKLLNMAEPDKERYYNEVETLIKEIQIVPDVPVALSNLSGKFVLFKAVTLCFLNILFSIH